MVYGLSNEDNIDLPSLLEGKCPCYERMQSIFGERANVHPFETYDNGVLEFNQRAEALECHQLRKNSPMDLGEVDDTDSNLDYNSFSILNDRNNKKEVILTEKGNNSYKISSQASSEKILEDEVISMETGSPIELHHKKKNEGPLSGPNKGITQKSKKAKGSSKLTSIDTSLAFQDQAIIKHLDYQQEKYEDKKSYQCNRDMNNMEHEVEEANFKKVQAEKDDEFCMLEMEHQCQELQLEMDCISAVNKWLENGSSPDDIEKLLKITFG
ncbi:hypothetical protein O181_110520 [Austropuccinia psidii MF-1]|uniref:Uncharacterized protein n=1 Tax=Austropuccinia psidii MF-1 TaxID=1389203 RepID=A0A9Q3K0J8_9BASI|nr:hypothetical protein [Austropuccinia psidii MF-1]